MKNILSLLAGLLLLAIPGLGAVISINPTVTQNGGIFTYSYAISIVPVGNERAYQFDLLGLAELLPAGLITSPPNWTPLVDISGGTINWISDDPAFDIIGPEVSGFSFQSTAAPGSVPYQLSLEDDQAIFLGVATGNTTGPVTATPEPATGLLLLPAFALLAGLRRRSASWAAMVAVALPLAGAPAVSVRVKDAPAWAPDISVRAGRTAVLDASASTGAGPLTFAWQQISGPNTLRWTSRAVAQPTISATVFGTYEVRVTVTDGTGSASANLRFGAVPTDDAGVVTPPTSDTAFLFAPLLRWGASPWPWLDERHRALADGFRGLLTSDPDFNASDIFTALPGTITITNGSAVITGVGTSFQTDFCGGPGRTVSATPIVIWYPVAGGTGRRARDILRCDSDTTLTLTSPFSVLPGTTAGVSYSQMRCPLCWVGQSSNMNYYDVVLAYYGLYYRSGRTEYLNQARILAERWWRGPVLDQGRSYISPYGGGPFYPIPRIAALVGVLWWAHETGRVDVWNSLYAGLDDYRALFQNSAVIEDVREAANQFGALAMAARLAPDPARRALYANAVASGLQLRWVPQLQPDGYYSGPIGIAGTGRATVTQGSNLVTFTGVSLTARTDKPSFWITNDSGLATGDSVSYLDPVVLNATTLQLPRPYSGASGANRFYQIQSLVGHGTQPFMMGIAGRMLELAYRATGDVRGRQLAAALGDWMSREGAQSSSRGLYYGRYFVNCTPIADAIPWCSYDATQPQEIQDSRYLSGGVLPSLSSAYFQSQSATHRQAGDNLTAAAMGKLGGPLTDSESADILNYSVQNRWFKDFGFFFGQGSIQMWPAARTGTPASQWVGR